MDKPTGNFNENVLYLEDGDFDQLGTLSDDVITVANGKPVFIMIQGSFCSWTQKAKPIFQSHANNTNQSVQHATILIDGNPSEQALGKRISKFIKGFGGVPTFALFVNGRYLATFNGPRTEEGFNNFLSKIPPQTPQTPQT